ncbi:MAG: hypothetical protein ACOYL2_02800 [Burkholderiaceae bacterium]|nr:hypothetical protein [Polynucleobacter sp.]MCF8187505.1 hypothetical protein [Sulfuritalea sp.]
MIRRPFSLQVYRACALILMLCADITRADTCDNLIKMDGLFTKARTECRFTYYAWRFQQDSQQCMEKKGKPTSKELFSQGQSAFTSKATSMGKEALCQKLLSDFPMTVKR